MANLKKKHTQLGPMISLGSYLFILNIFLMRNIVKHIRIFKYRREHLLNIIGNNAFPLWVPHCTYTFTANITEDVHAEITRYSLVWRNKKKTDYLCLCCMVYIVCMYLFGIDFRGCWFPM